MKEKEMDKIMAFDTLFTNNRIQMYKILLSYLQPALQQKFAIYIKFMELQYTISFFQNYPSAALKSLSHEIPPSSSQIFDEIMPFCDMSQKEHLNQLKSMMQNIESMKEMMEMIQMMKELFPEGMGNSINDGTGGGMDMSQLFGMLGGSDMSGMFDILNSFSASTEESPPQAP